MPLWVSCSASIHLDRWFRNCSLKIKAYGLPPGVAPWATEGRHGGEWGCCWQLARLEEILCCLSRRGITPKLLAHQRKMAKPPLILRNQHNHLWPPSKGSGTTITAPKNHLRQYLLHFRGLLLPFASLTVNLMTNLRNKFLQKLMQKFFSKLYSSPKMNISAAYWPESREIRALNMALPSPCSVMLTHTHTYKPHFSYLLKNKELPWWSSG